MIYMLEIYEPGSADDVWAYFESTAPFGSISVGDTVNPGLWEGSKSSNVCPERGWPRTHYSLGSWGRHQTQICVLTREVEGTRDLRTGILDD